MGKRIVDVQKCVRTGDLEDIGDNRHFSFFEMMGNWSLGDYFKDEAIAWSYEFLTSKDEGLGLDPKRLYITVFQGDENAPKDTESVEIWKKVGIPENRIYFLPAEDNWWSPGDNGPCGPCSEMFYDMKGTIGDLNHDEFLVAVKNEDVIEIWNDVFMEYEKKDGKVIGKLAQKNIDTGAGLERMTAVMQGVQTAYDTDIFTEMMSVFPVDTPIKNRRVIADHIRTSVFLIQDGVSPSNKDQGYVLRRLLRRAFVYSRTMTHDTIPMLINKVAKTYQSVYALDIKKIVAVITGEQEKFQSTLDQGLKEFEKGTDAFTLFTSYGFPIELTLELANEKGLEINKAEFFEKMKAHQDLSRSGAEQKFKGGLGNHNEQTVKLHTAHHLLLAALQQVLGKDVKQKGSNITEERLRMDFSFPRKVTPEELSQVESIVNNQIKSDLKVTRREMPREEAEKLGAEMEFGAKYPDIVSVYFIESNDGNVISKEFCGGPHVEHTGVLGAFKIQKEEAVSAGVRRIKATLS
jgi:alanyl-tRNA synthetase